MDSIFEALYITTQLMYSVATKEVWIIVLGGAFSWLWLDYSDRREQKRIEKYKENKREVMPRPSKPKSVRYATLKKEGAG